MDVRRQQVVYWPSVACQSLLPGINSVFILGYTNTGTNWLCQLVSNYLAVPLFEPWKRNTPSFFTPHVFHLHRFFPALKSNPRCIYLARDGRDVVVSKFFKIANNPNQQPIRRSFARKTGEKISAENIKDQLPAFIEWSFTDAQFGTVDWSSHIEQGFSDQVSHLTYEDLHRDAVGSLATLFYEIWQDHEIDLSKLESVVEARKMENVRTDANALHKRKGITGEWKRYFNAEARQVFAAHGQCALEIAGYESNNDWVLSDK